MKILFLLTFCTMFLSLSIYAHSGRTNSSGCHNNRKTGGYHCHKAQGNTGSQSINRTIASSEDWLGFVYKTGMLQSYKLIGPYTSKQKCLAASELTKRKNNYNTYECGLNCKKRPSGIYVCEKTVDS